MKNKKTKKPNKNFARGKSKKPNKGGRSAFSHKAGVRNEKHVDSNTVIKQGRIDYNARGYAFLVPNDNSGDVYISAENLNGAIHDDEVTIKIISSRRGAGEGEVIKIDRRLRENVVGRFIAVGESGGYIQPDDVHYPQSIYVPKSMSLNARHGEKVVAKLVTFLDRNMQAKIIEVLGYPSADVDVVSIIRAYNLYETFPRAVTTEAENLSREIDFSARRDFTRDFVITIDGDDSKDFDDAVSLVKTANGWRLSVHIADVSHYVKSGSKIDSEALKRGTSVYLCDRVLPMLPFRLSNDLCSLIENEPRLTLSLIINLSSSGEVLSHEICEGVIINKARLTYTQVADFLDGGLTCDKLKGALDMLSDMRTLALTLRQKRFERGNIEFDIPEVKITLDKNGKVIDVSKKQQLISHKIIEEFMLLANETVAKQFYDKKVPFVFRAHASPPPEKEESLKNFLHALNINFDSSGATPRDYAKLLSSVDESVASVVNRVTLRSMSKATYQPKNTGHFGLSADYYCHFTSPIRRYPDLMIHRIIKAYAHGGVASTKRYESEVGEVSKISSERERLAELAERKVDDLKKAEYMSDKIGEESCGIISGVTEWGIFVELDNGIEGLIRTEGLPYGNTEYVFNSDLIKLTSAKYTFKLGDALKIKVASVYGDKINFDFVSFI